MPTTLAPAPSRSMGSMQIGFGAVMIDVAVYTGVEDNNPLARQEYVVLADGTPAKVGRIKTIRDTGEPVNPSNVVMMIETPQGLVELSDDEIANAISADNEHGHIERFVPLSYLMDGTYLPDSVYQVRPRATRSMRVRRGASLTSEAAFTTLMEAMRVEQVFALVMVALRGKPRYAALTHDGRLTTLRYTNEVREDLPMPSIEINDNELLMTRMLVAAHTDMNARALINDAVTRVFDFVEAKATGGLLDAPVLEPMRAWDSLSEALRESVRALGMNRATAPVRRDELLDDPVVDSDPFTIGDRIRRAQTDDRALRDMTEFVARFAQRPNWTVTPPATGASSNTIRLNIT